MKHYLTDANLSAHQLRIYLNLENLDDLRADSRWPGLQGADAVKQLRNDGFEGVQVTHADSLTWERHLPYCGMNRINQPEDASTVFASHSDRGDECLTLHLGWGIEDDREAHLLIESVLDASEKYALPAYIETHRSTITQDMWRTVQFTKAFPEMLFNGDFSHYYCGQEMKYGDLETKLDFMQPIFDRVAFLHGRIAAPGFMQAPVDGVEGRPTAATGEVNYQDHFLEMWTRSMRGFRQNAPAGSVLIFAPELLSRQHYYARVFPDGAGNFIEESDRYEQALIYRDIAHHCWQLS